VPPIAQFNRNCTGWDCNFDASSSFDPDGSIVSYSWDFGDGSTGSGVTTSYTYAADGTYTVTLTVTDDAGSTNQTSEIIIISVVSLPGRVVASNGSALPGGGQRAMLPFTVMATFSVMSLTFAAKRRRISSKQAPNTGE
jgi:PKD repeat protein